MGKTLLFSEIPHKRPKFKKSTKRWVFTQKIYRGLAVFSLCLIVYVYFFEGYLGRDFFYMLIILLFINVLVFEIIWYFYFDYIIGHIIDIFNDGVVTRYKAKEQFYPKEKLEKIKIDGKEERIHIELKDQKEHITIRKSAHKIRGNYLDNLYDLEDATDKLNIELEIIYP